MFVPTYICNSPISPDTDMLILMRNAADHHVPGMDLGNQTNENIIEKKFSILPI